MLLSAAAGVFDRTGDTSHRFNRIWASISLLASGCRVSVEGFENITENSGYIIVSNHQSGFDIYALTACIPLQLRWIAKEILFSIPFLGRGMSAAGYISINRENPRKAVSSLNRAAETVRSGRSVVIFPEGTRTADGKLQEFKKGVFRIAKKANRPLIPVAIDGTFRIMKKGSLILTPSKVRIAIGKPVKYGGIKEEELLEKIRGMILEKLR